jgi:hypothetical protein
MKLLENVITQDNDYIEAGTKVQVIDEDILDWLNAIGSGIKSAGKFVLSVINVLAHSGIDQSDIERIQHKELSFETKEDVESEYKVYKDKYNIEDKTIRNTILNLIKMKHTNPELKDNAEKALIGIRQKLKLKDKSEKEETNN